jgi:hypothetical protein
VRDLATDEPARHTRLERTIGLAGLGGTALLFASVIVGSPGEPDLDASTASAATYVAGLDEPWVPVVGAVSDIAMMVVLWFMVGLALLLRRFEGEIPVRSTVAMLSGTLVAAYVVLDPAEEAAAHRVVDLGQGQLAYAYDVGSIGFTNVWLAMGSFAFACGWIIVSTKAMPVWLGWWGALAGIAMALAQLVWTTESLWVAPYAVFWLWLLTTSALLLRRPRRGA